MFRRALGASAPRSLATASNSVRAYTNYDHMKYPTYWFGVTVVAGYFIAMWFIFVRQGSLFTARGEYKTDLLRVWRRKLGTGYQWSDAWGPQMDTVYRNLPSAVEESEEAAE